MWPAPSKKRSRAEESQTLLEASRNLAAEGMQDPASMPGLAGRIFGGGGGGGGGGLERRRLRGYGQLQQPVVSSPVIKCPRCDSANTKFCYYNNYNLSQPRHFCKSCRRYWTRGGVLRNVPVGGGCRKPSSSKKPSNSAAAGKERRRVTSSRSSSDTSTLTTSTPPDLIVLPNSNLNPSASNPPPVRASEPLQASTSFTDLVATNPAAIMGFGFSNLPQISTAEETRLPEPSTVEATAFGEQTAGGVGGGGFSGLDWAGPVMDPSVFDLASAVDQGLFWNPSQSQTHWADADPSSLYLP